MIFLSEPNLIGRGFPSKTLIALVKELGMDANEFVQCIKIEIQRKILAYYKNRQEAGMDS